MRYWIRIDLLDEIAALADDASTGSSGRPAGNNATPTPFRTRYHLHRESGDLRERFGSERLPRDQARQITDARAKVRVVDTDLIETPPSWLTGPHISG